MAAQCPLLPESDRRIASRKDAIAMRDGAKSMIENKIHLDAAMTMH
jgi:hypothetical protein